MALEALSIDRSVREALGSAAKRFTDDLRGIEDMRDGLTHFDDWSRGMGRGPQKMQRNVGRVPRDVARHFWQFGYDPGVGTVSFGPYAIDLDVADKAARELCAAVYQAAHAVDEKNTAELRALAVTALTTAGVMYDAGEPRITVSSGRDLKVWLSLAGSDSGELARRIVQVLADAGLRLVSVQESQAHDQAARLGRGESLYVELEA